jgi:hypothetical protein
MDFAFVDSRAAAGKGTRPLPAEIHLPTGTARLYSFDAVKYDSLFCNFRSRLVCFIRQSRASQFRDLTLLHQESWFL